MNHITSLSGIPTNLKRLPWVFRRFPFHLPRFSGKIPLSGPWWGDGRFCPGRLRWRLET
jgi:hypothetical protein